MTKRTVAVLEQVVLLHRGGHSATEISGLLPCRPSQGTVSRWLRQMGLAPCSRKGPRKGSLPRLCRYCGEMREDRFVRHSKGRNSLSRCKACHAVRSRFWHQERRRACVEFLGGECARCGYRQCLAALHFHHRDPAEKDPEWKRIRVLPIARIEAELSKCELLCANCHAEEHDDAIPPDHPALVEQARKVKTPGRPPSPLLQISAGASR